MLQSITVNTQSSIRIARPGSTIYLDPLQIAGEPHDADFILITHNHGDHYSVADIRKIANPQTVLIVPQRMEAQAQELKSAVGSIEAVQPGARVSVRGLELETVSAYNLLKPFHPRSAGWVGYILILDNVRLYAAGDTDVTKESKAVQCDIAMVPIGGTYTMTAKQAAELVNTIKPTVVIPIHYGSIVGSVTDADTFASLTDPEIRVELKL
ncbi:MAG: MBL fold metallo-hydrolase [Oscillospiraceae bacterium]|nr:MBL fold metallo-hydrolase [Oscillospiraceae bacterium]